MSFLGSGKKGPWLYLQKSIVCLKSYFCFYLVPWYLRKYVSNGDAINSGYEVFDGKHSSGRAYMMTIYGMLRNKQARMAFWFCKTLDSHDLEIIINPFPPFFFLMRKNQHFSKWLKIAIVSQGNGFSLVSFFSLSSLQLYENYIFYSC